MSLNEENIKLIFGIKLKQLRKQNNLSLVQLAEKAGMSVSYVNEIEKGKKYPKQDKIISLANALNTNYDKLVSTKLNKHLEPISEILSSAIFNELPLETFGINKDVLIQMIANAPTKVTAFLGAIMEISRNYNMRQEHFYFASLRSYQEMEDNYFEEIEDTTTGFIKKYKLNIKPPIEADFLEQVLTTHFKYKIVASDFKEYPELKTFRSIYVPHSKGGHPTLVYNKKLTQQQRAFLFSKEIGFNFLELEERPTTSSWLKVESFEQVLNNFNASYFSCALLINKDLLIKDLEAFFSRKKWNNDAFLEIMHKYNASPEMFMHRLTNILPQFFGMKQLFFIRYSDKASAEKEITKELHLSRTSSTLNGNIDELVYRRWLTKRVVDFLENKRSKEKSKEVMVNAIRSKFTEKGNEYFCISINRPKLFVPGGDSVTIGFVLTDAIKKKLQFIEDNNIHFLRPREDFQEELITPEALLKEKALEEKEKTLKKFVKDLD